MFGDGSIYPKELERSAVQRVCGSLPMVKLTREVMITTYNMNDCVTKTANDRGNWYPKARQSDCVEFESMPPDLWSGGGGAGPLMTLGGR